MKKIFIALVSLMLFTGAFFGYNAYQKISMDPLLKENIQALAEITVFERPCFLTVTFDKEAETTLDEGGWILEVIFCGTCDWLPIIDASNVDNC